MYVSDWSSDVSPRAEAPRRQRSHGQLSFDVTSINGLTRPARIAESGPSRIRLPNVPTGELEAVIMNTGGGVACGDRFEVAANAGPDTHTVMTTPAAERVYKSDGPVATVDVSIRVEKDAVFSWLPQETILYDRARLRRSFSAEIAGSASFSMFESIVFGRAAHGERIAEGLLEDRWRIRRDGKLIYADTLRLEGPIADLLDKPSIAKGSRALATFLHVAPDAENRLEPVRELMENASCDCAASSWNGMLVLRFLAPDIGSLRRAAIDILTRFRGAPLPRVWHS